MIEKGIEIETDTGMTDIETTDDGTTVMTDAMTDDAHGRKSEETVTDRQRHHPGLSRKRKKLHLLLLHL